MRRRDLLAAAGAAVATGIAGCSNARGTGAAAPAETDTAEPTDSTATQTPGAPSRVVTVSGTGEVTGDPDRAIVRATIEARADSAGAVRNDLATRGSAVREALTGSGVPEDSITTDYFSIDERIDHRALRESDADPESEAARERFRYYQGTNALRVELDDVEAVGSVIDTAVDAGADEIGHVLFTLSEERRTELREQALREAIRGARAKAQAAAEEVDGEIVEATVVDASDGRIDPVQRSGDTAAAATPTPAPEATPTQASSTGVDPGEVTVRVSVDVRFAMR